MQLKNITRILLVLLAFPLVAPAAEVGSGGVASQKKVKQNQRVCKKVKPTGSHIGQRVCLKKKEWDAMERAAQEKLRNSTTHSRGGVSQGG